MSKRKLRYMIKYKEGEYLRTGYAFTKKTAKEKARMFNGKIYKIKTKKTYN